MDTVKRRKLQNQGRETWGSVGEGGEGRGPREMPGLGFVKEADRLPGWCQYGDARGRDDRQRKKGAGQTAKTLYRGEKGKS